MAAFSAFLLAGASPAPAADGLRAGFAEEDITPEVGMEIPGGYVKAFHRKLHDPCKVRAAVFDDGTKRVALVGVDALMVPRALVAGAREKIREACGIPPEAVLVAASHSHSSGPVGMVQPGQFDHADPAVRAIACEKTSAADAGYLDRVREAVVKAVTRADAARAEVRGGIGSGTEGTVSFNRRFRMKNGLTYTHPRRGNPDIVEAAGPIDPEVGVVGAWDPAGKLLGCVVTFACHATTSPDGISANWIYYMERAIRGSIEPGAVVVFLPGFCGDITQVDNLSPFAEPSGGESAKIVGGRVGAEAVKVLVGMARGREFPLDAAAEVVRFGRRVPDPERLKRCREIALKDPKEVGHAEWVFAKEIVLLDALLAKEPEMEAELQAIQVGPAVFLATPGEMFCRQGLDLKAARKFPFTFPVEMANGCVGYVPTEEALGEKGGGYETRLTSYSNLEPAAGRRMVEGLLGLAGRMKPGPVPQPPKAAPFKAPWSYGNVPPELK